MSRFGFRRLAQIGLFSLPWLGPACSQVPVAERTIPGPMQLLPDSPVDPAMTLTQAETTPESPATTPDHAAVRLSGAASDPAIRQQVPISLDTVLRVAEEQNPQIGVARTKANVAFAEKQAAAARWLPDLYLGVGYFRHAGGIQLQEGPLVRSSTGAFATALHLNAEYNPREHAFRQVDAARKVWQNQGELSKITYEQLLDASTTYIDLLAAHAAIAISKEFENKANELHEKVKKLYDMFKTADVEIEKTRVESELKLQQQMQTKLRGEIERASAKLAYLLGMDPNTELLPIETQMVVFNIVDLQQPVDALVGQALANGPGVRELEGILCLIQSGLGTAQGAARFVPVVKLQMGEGLFAAGPFGILDWSNRWDMGLQARWNITEVFQAKQKKNLALSQMNQAQMTYQELRARLTLGVQEARTTAEASSAQFSSAKELIEYGQSVAKNVQKQRDNNKAIDSDVLQAHKAVALAQLNYVDMIREYDKAQLRLMVLLGPGAR